MTLSTMLIRYLLFWFLLAFVAVANGVLRETTYGKYVSELLAHQIATATCILFMGLLVWGVSRFWQIESSGQAWFIGACWFIATIAFEFGFGHFVVGHSWSKLLSDYNIFNGRIWVLIPVWITFLPYVFYRY